MRLVMAMDPGGTTGVAWALFKNDWTMEVESWKCCQVPCADENEGVDRLLKLIGRTGPDILVLEDFILLPKIHTMDRSGIAPARINAKIDWEVWKGKDEWMFSPPEIVYQMPSERMVIRDDWLKRKGLWRTPKAGGGQHAMDAARHLEVYRRKMEG